MACKKQHSKTPFMLSLDEVYKSFLSNDYYKMYIDGAELRSCLVQHLMYHYRAIWIVSEFDYLENYVTNKLREQKKTRMTSSGLN